VSGLSGCAFRFRPDLIVVTGGSSGGDAACPGLDSAASLAAAERVTLEDMSL
jgi:hypothetical protein